QWDRKVDKGTLQEIQALNHVVARHNNNHGSKNDEKIRKYPPTHNSTFPPTEAHARQLLTSLAVSPAPASMLHENLRVARNHRGLAARAAAVEIQPEPTADDEHGDGHEDRPSKEPPTKDEPPQHVTPTPPISPQTTLSVVKPVVPTSTDTVVAGTPSTTTVPTTSIPTTSVPTTSGRPSTTTTTTPVLPTTTTSSIVTPSTSSSKSVPIKSSTVFTVEKVSSASHATISAKASASSAPVASGAVSGGAVAGGVIGGLAGLALLIALRHYRKKSLEDLVFNASKFRRSALLLDDPPEKQKMQEQRGPRPPSTIARHFNAPAVPQASAASPYGEHAVQSTDPYGHYAAATAQYNLGMYGADGQVTRDPYAELYSGNSSSGQHASSGQPAFGATPRQFQFPQRPYHQHQEYQSSFVSGAQTSAAAVNAPLPHPFSNATSTSPAITAARTAAQSQPTPSNSSRPNSRDISSKPEVLHRRPSAQSTGSADAEHPKYANIQRDVKVAPDALPAANNDNNGYSSSASAASPATTNATSASTARSNTRRPVSSYTVYDPEDAYGGM
ncbi:hypothetical protein C0992_009090, partial [Termitomyces sp. T32_za158]